MSNFFYWSCRDVHFLFCFLLYPIFFLLFFFFLRLGEGPPPPPLRTTTLIQTRAPQQLGFCCMQLATISNACAKQKIKLVSREPDTRANGVPRPGETRDDGKRKEDRITSPTEPLTSTHWGQKNHVKFQSQYFFCPRSGRLFRRFLSGILQIHFWLFWKCQAPLVFGWPTKSILVDFSTQKSFDENILGKKRCSHNRAR